MKKSLICDISNLRRCINVPASALNAFIGDSFMDNLIAGESRIENGNGFIFRTGEENRDVDMVPLNFVYFGGMVVGCINV